MHRMRGLVLLHVVSSPRQGASNNWQFTRESLDVMVVRGYRLQQEGGGRKRRSREHHIELNECVSLMNAF